MTPLTVIMGPGGICGGVGTARGATVGGMGLEAPASRVEVSRGATAGGVVMPCTEPRCDDKGGMGCGTGRCGRDMARLRGGIPCDPVREGGCDPGAGCGCRIIPGMGGWAGSGRCCLGGNNGGDCEDEEDTEDPRRELGDVLGGGGRGGGVLLVVVGVVGILCTRGGGRATVSPPWLDTELRCWGSGGGGLVRNTVPATHTQTLANPQYSTAIHTENLTYWGLVCNAVPEIHTETLTYCVLVRNTVPAIHTEASLKLQSIVLNSYT